MGELEIDKKYPVSEIRKLSTKYGEKIIVELEDASVISLPQRCVNRALDYLKLNDIIPLYFVYLGSKDTGDMRALYSGMQREGGARVCSLARMCQNFLIALDDEEGGYIMFPEIHTQILKYLLQICRILSDEKDIECKKRGCDILCELTDILA
ncbi:hypothetical protein AVEN_114201-1 [Araneus ventricosus]|uniref:Uncharacterized protein n=1 Tax=Araneus ventricosus TaxID=182803 RepID=A0A4Y2CD57_ARAVE|nr:hypothetical protein AVEN_114201-1 [Araneus ventricosus]